MNGTEKQVLWAEKIRAAAADMFNDYFEDIDSDISDPDTDDDDRAEMIEQRMNAQQALEWIMENDSAAWWIEHRYTAATAYIRLYNRVERLGF